MKCMILFLLQQSKAQDNCLLYKVHCQRRCVSEETLNANTGNVDLTET